MLDHLDQQEEKEKERIAFAEQEARTSLLRARSGKNTASIKPTSSEQKDICLYQESGHFNLFALEEQEGESSGKKDNKEYIAEKKAEKEDYEKKIGLLTYLGQSAVESKECMPWYLERRKEVKEKEDAKTKNIIEDQRDKSRKDRLDPIQIVEKNLKKMKKHSEHKKKKKKEKDRKEKSSSSSMAQLREERLKRKREERAKAEELLGGSKSQAASP